MAIEKVRPFNGKITVVCGEYSGEVHATNLVRRLSSFLSLHIYAVGGALLQREGVELICDYREISLTGLTEVLKKLVSIRAAYERVKNHLRTVKPSLVILVDFPGFNLRIAKIAKKEGLPVVYFIPPQIWAWGKKRIKAIKEYVDLVICLFPFEKEIYDYYGVRSKFVGHPYVGSVKPRYGRREFLKEFDVPDVHPIVGLFPGSRLNEVRKHMPYLKRIVDETEKMFDSSFFVIAQAHGINSEEIEKHVFLKNNVRIVRDFSHDILFHSDCAILASGSVTLEAAILGVPSVVIYRLSPLSYLLGKIMVKVPYVSLPNIILGKMVFPEFIQKIDPEKIAVAVNDMLKKEKKKEMKDLSQVLLSLLGGPETDVYQSAAKEIFDFLRETYGFVFEAA